MINYLYALLSDLFFSSGFVIQKKYQQKSGTSIGSGLIFNLISAAVLSVILLVLCFFTPQVSAYSLVSAFLQALVVFTYTVISFYILRAGSLSLYTMFLMTGGMIVPFVWGICFLNETVTFFQLAGLVLITISIILTSFEKKKSGIVIVILCVIVFFVNGMSSVLTKLHQTESVYATIDNYDYMFWSSVFRFALSLLLLPFAGLGKAEKPKTAAVWLAFAGAVASGLASYFNLMGASKLPATVLYPLITGGTIVLSAVLEAIVFRKKLVWKEIFPVLLCLAGTFMFL